MNVSREYSNPQESYSYLMTHPLTLVISSGIGSSMTGKSMALPLFISLLVTDPVADPGGFQGFH